MPILSPIRSPVRSPVRSLLGASSMVGVIAGGLGGLVPYHFWDFTQNRAMWNGAFIGGVTNTPNLTITRASTGYAQTAAGALVNFGSGVLRMTDKGLLVEGARTNLCLQSQTFDNASWTKGAATVSANSVAAPDGSTTADSIVEDAATAQHGCFQSISVSNGTIYTYSCYLKAAGRSWVYFQVNRLDASFPRAWFNLGSGAVGTVQAGLTASISAMSNGWYRCIVTFDSLGASAGLIDVRMYSATADTIVTHAGNSAAAYYAWQADLQQGAFPSSPITTTSASATRAADVLTVTSPGVTYPLSLFAEFERVVDTGGVEVLLGLTAASTERVELVVDASDRASIFQVAGGSLVAAPFVTGSIAVGATTKAAARAVLNDVQVARAGSLGTADTSAAAPSAPTTITFGQRNSANDFSFGYLRRAAIFSRALSDAELTGITV